MTATVSSVFLGLTVGCAQCHDHKYDRIPTKDFYRMKAFFATVQIPRPRPGDGFQLGGPLPAEFYRAGEKEWAGKLTAERQAELKESRAALAELDKLEAAGKKAEPKAGLSPDQKSQQTEWKSRVRLLEQDLMRLQPMAMSLRHSYGPPFEPGVPETRVLIRGEWDKPGEVVEPGFLSCVTGDQRPAMIRLDPFKRWPTRSRRITLARWIASEENPLTARVMVNRLWGWHFGRGLVATPSDFGKLSGGPSHPELLDWLAVEFMEPSAPSSPLSKGGYDGAWDMKRLLKLLVMSATYRQSSRATPERLEADPRNRLLTRGSRFRLEAEMVRDQALALSGLLSRKSHGPSVFPPQPAGMWQAAFNGERTWSTSSGEDKYRRALYTLWRRTVPYPSMATFDAPSRELCTVRRIRTNTPLQAFVTLNDPVYVEAAQALARRIVREGGESTVDRARYGLQLCLARPAGAPQVDQLVELFAAELEESRKDDKAALELATDPLGPLPEGMSAPELAAWTVVANVLLNLDGVLTKN
jgi:hypothetical protein